MRRATMLLSLLLLATATVLAASPEIGREAWRPLAELAASGQWGRILEIVRPRARQVPLDPRSALIAAVAAREVEAPDGERLGYLRRAAGPEGYRQIAAVEWARAMVETEPDTAFRLALPVVRHPETAGLGQEAAEVLATALEHGARAGERDVLRAIRRRPRTVRRRIELALALRPPVDPSALRRLLANRSNDLVAYRAARALQDVRGEHLHGDELWLVARALQAHGLWGEAAPLLERTDREGAGKPRWQVAFLRGRCAFRQERWDEAVRWYRTALQRTHSRKRRAELEVHAARALELGGDPGTALTWVRRAIGHEVSDDRLLMEVRLALLTGHPAEARRAAQRCRGRSARERGSILLALDALRTNDHEKAVALLDSVRHRPWAGPAAVVSAMLAASAGDPEEAVEQLDRAAASGLEPFWEAAARRTMAGLPPEAVRSWRRRSGPAAGSDMDRIVRWATLEPDWLLLEAARRSAWGPAPSAPQPLGGMAATLWAMGVRSEAARWDPSGFSTRTAIDARWSAGTFAGLGLSGRAMVAADRARRHLHPRTPIALLPRDLARALFPLPEPLACRREAAAAGIPWPLLAAIVRAESRWDPTALSAVGARGLVQLMPETAARLARSLSEPVPEPEALFDPGLALHLGAAELARLTAALGPGPVGVAAAYNAGEAQTRLWQAQCPEPCSPESLLLTITFGATRTYAANVAAATGWYRRLYGSAATGDRPAAATVESSPTATQHLE